MRHLHVNVDPTQRAAQKSTHRRRFDNQFRNDGRPGLCSGCGQSFPIRLGWMQAQLGQDGRLYCFAMTQECGLLALLPDAAKNAA